MLKNNQYEFKYYSFPLSSQNLEEYADHGYSGIIDCIIASCASGNFEVNSEDAYNACERMIEKCGCDEDGVYNEETREALKKLYERYYEIYGNGKEQIVLKDKPKTKMKIFLEKLQGLKNSLLNFGRALRSPFRKGYSALEKLSERVHNFSFREISVKKPKFSFKKISVKKPKGLKYYLGAIVTAAVVVFGMKSDGFSFLKKTQKDAKDNKTELKVTAQQTSQNVQEKSTISFEEASQLSSSKINEKVSQKNKTGKKTNIEPNPEPESKTKESKVAKIQKNKDNYQKTQTVSQNQSKGATAKAKSFHQSRLNKFLGQQGAQELCNKVKSKCPQMTGEEVALVAYGYVMNCKYALGTDNPIDRALSSSKSLTRAEQADLVKYVKEKIGDRGQIAQKRAQNKSDVSSRAQSTEQNVVNTAKNSYQVPAWQNFHNSRLEIFLGQKGSEELCNKIKHQISEGIFSLEEGMSVEFVAYAQAIGDKYSLGKDNPVSKALASTKKLSESEQKELNRYIREEIGDKGQYAKNRAQMVASSKGRKLNKHSSYNNASKSSKQKAVKAVKSLKDWKKAKQRIIEKYGISR